RGEGAAQDVCGPMALRVFLVLDRRNPPRGPVLVEESGLERVPFAPRRYPCAHTPLHLLAAAQRGDRPGDEQMSLDRNDFPRPPIDQDFHFATGRAARGEFPRQPGPWPGCQEPVATEVDREVIRGCCAHGT